MNHQEHCGEHGGMARNYHEEISLVPLLAPCNSYGFLLQEVHIPTSVQSTGVIRPPIGITLVKRLTGGMKATSRMFSNGFGVNVGHVGALYRNH
jgi:hypothetical protein